MPLKIAVIGAGSVGFTRIIVRDLLAVPELADTHFVFTDINQHNLDMVKQLVERDIAGSGLPATVSSTQDRREAFKDANYVYCFIRQGGLEAFQTDIDIPLQYGVDQCVGDTLCAGGIMYGQRTMHAMRGICKDISEVAAPNCLLLNYSNPMAMNTWTANHYGYGVRVVGLCHGVHGGIWQISQALNIPQEELDIICAGINHQTWYIGVKHKGVDLTGKILEAFEKHETFSKQEKVRIDMIRRFGYYSTESNGHLSEYLPWYRKRASEINDWISLDAWIMGETGGYLRVCNEGRNWFEHDFPNWMQADPWTHRPEDRSHEHGSFIVESLETGRIYRGHFNVVNHGAISNLPDDCIVEVPGYVDGNGIGIPRVGDLPLGCAAVCNASISVQRLSVEAAMHGDINLLRQAFMMDPLVGAVCTPPEIWQLVDDMLIAQAEWLPQYAQAIGEAKWRRDNLPRIPVKEGYEGAARLHTKTVDEMEAAREEATKNAGAAEK